MTEHITTIDLIIADLPRILDEHDHKALVKWCKKYATEGEGCMYGGGNRQSAVRRIFGEHGIVEGQNEGLMEDGLMRAKNAKVQSEFIAGQLLKFSIHPRYFGAAADWFLDRCDSWEDQR